MPNSMHGRLWLLVVILFAALCALSGCSGTEKEKESVVSVQTTTAARGPIEQTVFAEAVVFPLEQATVQPKITSTVKKFHVQRGSRVRKGQLLAELENTDLSAAAQSSQGDLEQAQASYTTTIGAGLPQQIQKAELDTAASKSALDAQQKIYNSRKDLFQQGAIPRRDLDAADVALVQARSQYEQAQRQLADLQRLGKEQTVKSAHGSLTSSEGKYRAAEAQLSYSLIRSPIDGVITDRPLYEGDLATANQPLLVVMNTSRLIAKSHISQSVAMVLKVGNPAELTVPGLDEPVNGMVKLVSPALDPGSTTIEVWVEVRKPDPALRPGMTVQESIVAKAAKDAIVVPSDAVFKNAEGADYVLVAGSDHKAHQTVIQTGIRNKDLTQVISGIKPGDPVITAGGYAVPDGTQIKVEQPSAEGKEAASSWGDKGDQKDEKQNVTADKKASPTKNSGDKGKE